MEEKSKFIRKRRVKIITIASHDSVLWTIDREVSMSPGNPPSCDKTPGQTDRSLEQYVITKEVERLLEDVMK
jgi:hypothetical protein